MAGRPAAKGTDVPPFFQSPRNVTTMNRRFTLALGASLLAMPAVHTNKVYANNITGLVPDIYAALDVISRELVGFVPAVARNTSAERAAVGEPIVFHRSPTMNSYDIRPAMQVPEPPDWQMGTDRMYITKSKGVPFGITGEEQRGLNNGPGFLSIQADLIAQAMRTLVNEIETDVATEAALNASRAYGTPGSTPFAGGDLSPTAQLKKILDDNGAPLTDRALIVNTTAGANLRVVPNLTRVNEAGSQLTLRDGELLNLHGLSIHESAQVLNFVKGTAASATTNAGGYGVGARTITLAAAGTGTIKAGDIVTFAGDLNKYQVETGDTDTSNGGTITLRAPGLRQSIPAAATAITVLGSAFGTPYNVAFVRNAMQLVTRAPAIPAEGDAAVDRLIVTDVRSGLSFEICVYLGYKKVTWEVGIAWGVKNVNPAHTAILLG